MHYVCSDIHGQYGLYRRLIDELELQESDTLYVIGDAIDRGPDSVGILKDIMSRPNVELFLGNHELMMLDHYAGTGYPGIWTHESNGGTATLSQMEELTKGERKEILDYVSNTWLQKYIAVGDRCYALHHSYWITTAEGNDIRFSELDRSNWTAVFDAVWNSPYRLFEHVHPDEYIDGCIHVIGHVPVQFVAENQAAVRDGKIRMEDIRPPFIDADGHIYNIDGGCSLRGRSDIGGLYCMSLEADENGHRKEFWIR